MGMAGIVIYGMGDVATIIVIGVVMAHGESMWKGNWECM